MAKEIQIETLRYFLTTYFVQTFTWDELHKLVYDFRYGEHQQYIDSILEELYMLRELDDWKFISPLLKTDDRRFPPKYAKELVETMIRCLTDETFDPETYVEFT